MRIVAGLVALLAGIAGSSDSFAEEAAPVRYRPLAPEAGEVSRSLLYRYLSDAESESQAVLAGAARLKLGPFLAARLKSTGAPVILGARSARLRVQLDEDLAVSAQVLALNQRSSMQEVLDMLRAGLQAAGPLVVRAPTPGELQLVWPNIGWDLTGGVWVAEAGAQRLLFDLPGAADDNFIYIETLDADASCFRFGELAKELGADCLCASIEKVGDVEQIVHQTQCPVAAPTSGADVQRAQPQERT